MDLRRPEQLATLHLALRGGWRLEPLPFQLAFLDHDTVFRVVGGFLVLLVALAIF